MSHPGRAGFEGVKPVYTQLSFSLIFLWIFFLLPLYNHIKFFCCLSCKAATAKSHSCEIHPQETNCFGVFFSLFFKAIRHRERRKAFSVLNAASLPSYSYLSQRHSFVAPGRIFSRWVNIWMVTLSHLPLAAKSQSHPAPPFHVYFNSPVVSAMSRISWIQGSLYYHLFKFSFVLVHLVPITWSLSNIHLPNS